MKITRLFLLFFTLSFISYSQERPPELQKKLDSLWQVWEDKTQLDTLRLKALFRYTWNGYVDFEKADSIFHFSQSMYDFAERKDLKKFMGHARYLQAVSFVMKEDHFNTLKHFQLALELHEKYGTKRQISNDLYGIGRVYYKLQDYVKAMEYMQRTINIDEEIGVTSNSTLNVAASVYQVSGDYDKALEFLQKSLDLYKKKEDNQGVGFGLSEIGEMYRVKGDYTKALDYAQRGLKIYKESGGKMGLPALFSTIGEIYSDMQEYSKALEFFQKSMNAQEGVNNEYVFTSTLIKIGNVYNKQGNHLKAIDKCQESLKRAKEVEIPELPFQKAACNCLYDAYKALGNGNKALEYHEQMNVLEDSINAKETSKKLQQLEFRELVRKDSLATVEKERKLEEAHKEEIRQKDRNKNMAIAAGIFLLLVSGGFYSRWRFTKKAKAVIEKEKDRSENLLLNILPAEVAEELKQKGEAEARDYDMVSILFTDFKSFTEQSEKMSAAALVKEINNCFKAFDAICEKYSIEKIKTIGDAYMAAGGLPIPEDNSVKNTVLAALEMQAFIVKQHQEKEAKGEHAFQMRVGIHTGPVVAGIVGVKKFQYDIWGDTVNTASRIESNGEVGKVNISEATYNYLKGDPDFVFESRGKIQAKGKGEVEMYFVSLA